MRGDRLGRGDTLVHQHQDTGLARRGASQDHGGHPEDDIQIRDW